MRILHCVESYPPSVGGMQYVVRELSERLVRRGHDVTVATRAHPDRPGEAVVNGVRVVSFGVSGNLVRGLEGDVDAYRRFLAAARFEVVTLFAAQQWATDVAFEQRASLAGKLVFVPTGFSGLHDPRYAGYFERMPGWMRSADANVFLAERYRDVDFARAHGVPGLTLIPNGAAEEEFGAPSPVDVRARLGVPAGHALVLHVGSFTGEKGQPEALAIFRRAGLRDATLLLVGDPANRKAARRVARRARLHALSPLRLLDRTAVRAVALDRAATVAAFQQADLLLFPSNIECSPIVLFEAAAAGTPFLCTDVGNAGEIARWTGAGELMATRPRGDAYRHVDPDVADGAARLAALLRDRPRREAMAARGREAWRARFTWGAIAGEYEALYRGLLDGRAPAWAPPPTAGAGA